MKAYYAHCKAIYDTPQEVRDIALIEKLGFTCINPNTAEIKKRLEEYTDSYNKMLFFKQLVEESDLVIFRSLPDGSIPCGVFKEIVWAKEFGIPVLELPSKILRREMTLEQTREYLAEIGER